MDDEALARYVAFNQLRARWARALEADPIRKARSDGWRGAQGGSIADRIAAANEAEMAFRRARGESGEIDLTRPASDDLHPNPCDMRTVEMGDRYLSREDDPRSRDGPIIYVLTRPIEDEPPA